MNAALSIPLAASTLVMLIAAFMRLTQITTVPPGPFFDEAVNILIARGIAYGGQRPVYTLSFVGREPLYHYIVAILMRLTGQDSLSLYLTSVFAGVFTVAASVAIAREFFRGTRHRVWLTLLTGILAAAIYWPVAASRFGVRAITVAWTCSMLLWYLLRLWRRGRRIDAIWAGVWTGATAYTYLPNRFVPIALALVIGWLWLRDRRRFTWRNLALFGVVALIVAGPMLVFVVHHPDVIAHRAQQVAGVRPDMPLMQIVLAVLTGMLGFLEGFGIHGDPVLYYNLPDRPVFDPVLAFCFYLGLIVLIVQSARRTRIGVLSGAVALWLAVMALPSALSTEPFMTLRTLGTLPVAMLLPPLGMSAIVTLIEHFRRIPRWALAAVSIVILAVTVRETYFDYFLGWARVPELYSLREGDLADLARWFNQHDTGDTPIYILTFNYQPPTMAIIAEDYDWMKWVVLGRTVVFPPDGEAAYIGLPQSTLAVGDANWLQNRLASGQEIASPRQPDGRAGFQVFYLPPDAPRPSPISPMDINYANAIRLIGSSENRDEPGLINLTLYWDILGNPPLADYGLVMHLVDQWGFHWAIDGTFNYPPEQWTPGERMVQELSLERPVGMPPGPYHVELEWYSPSTQQRLPVIRENAFAGTVGVIEDVMVEADTSGKGRQPSIQFPHRTDLGALTLRGYDREQTEIVAGDVVRLALYWEAANAPDRDVSRSVFLRDASGREILLTEGDPVRGTHPTSRWAAGEEVTDRSAVRIDPDLPAGDYTVWLRVEGTGDPVSLGDLVVKQQERTFTPPLMSHPQTANFGDVIRLLGYDLDGSFEAGQTLHLRPVWQSITPPETGYSVFVHVVDANNQIVAQHDGIPQGSYPLDRWLPGEVVIEHIILTLPSNLTHGTYRIKIGLYRPQTGERLPVLESSGQTGIDFVWLETSFAAP